MSAISITIEITVPTGIYQSVAIERTIPNNLAQLAWPNTAPANTNHATPNATNNGPNLKTSIPVNEKH